MGAYRDGVGNGAWHAFTRPHTRPRVSMAVPGSLRTVSPHMRALAITRHVLMMDGTDAPFVCAASVGAHRPGRIDSDRLKRDGE